MDGVINFCPATGNEIGSLPAPLYFDMILSSANIMYPSSVRIR